MSEPRINLDEVRALLASVEGFTAGPWRGDRNDGTVKYTVRGGDGRIVLTVDHKNSRYGFVVGDNYDQDRDIGGEHDEDERLFLAAPDLHRELSAAVDEIELLRAELAKPVAREWTPYDLTNGMRRDAGSLFAAACLTPGPCSPWGWRIARIITGKMIAQGRETGDASRHAADLALTAIGYRLVGGVHPLPDEVQS